jgi:LmbE family N-acetylglucosaminyl deacetylase
MNLAVLSPHLDDAVLSVGERIARKTRRGDRVSVVTVLAGDPDSRIAAGPWDEESGFQTAGEAARGRRQEDRQACAVVGAHPVWLPFGDEQYARGGGDDEIWASVFAALGAVDAVLAPGFPLAHRDHRWLAALVMAHRSELPRLGLYTEQPYALGKGRPRDDLRLTGDPGIAPPEFEPSPRDARAWLAKRRARRCYRSQLSQLGRWVQGSWRELEREIGRWERRWGTEPVAWLDGPERA